MKYLIWKIRFFFVAFRVMPGIGISHAFYLANSWDREQMDDLTPAEAAREEHIAEMEGA